MRRAAVTEAGPNDASGVVWAIGMTILFYLSFFIYTNY